MLSTVEADLDAAGTKDTMNGLATSASQKLIALTPPGKVPGFDQLSGAVLKEVFSTDNVKSVLEQSAADQMHLMGSLKRLTVAAYVEHGHLPEEALKTINANGTINANFEGSPTGSDQDIVMGADGKPLAWDLDGDGLEPSERQITERELYDATLGPGEATYEGVIGLHEKHWAAHNPPDIDDLSVPDGFKNDDANFLEGIFPGDQGAEDVIESGGHVAARQEDLRWNPVEGVYDLPVEAEDGTKSELHYQHDGKKWQAGREDRRHMAERRLALLVVAGLATLFAGGCGGDEPSAAEKQVKEEFDRATASRREAVDRMVADGKLPPVAAHVLNANGTLNVNFIDGPMGDEDVVRTSSDGSSGKKLAWDLDQNGKIDESERTITERELYDATLGIY